MDVEISDVAAVVAILGLAGAAVAATWMVTRNPKTLKSIARIAGNKGARLVHHGVPLLK